MSKPPINLNFQPTQKKVRFYTDDGVLGRRIVTTFQGRPIVLDVYGNPTVATDDVSILAVFKKMLSEYSLITVVQFTGQFDNTGEEIWEGSIIKSFDDVLGCVYFDEDVLGWRILYQNGDWEDLYEAKSDIVCVGHMLLNPELMEEKK